MTLRLGLERLMTAADAAGQAQAWGRIGLLCNQASVTRDFTPAWQVLRGVVGPRLVALFGPQHGFAGTAQDNMIETQHARHLATGLPVYSLYSETREPTAAMLSGLDTLVIDLQIVGCRIYTWKSTIAACLRAAKKQQKRVVVLDRPNPVGGVWLEGRVLDADCHSFVGQFSMPMRHGLTAGEAARFFNAEIGAELTVVELQGWQPETGWRHAERPWVLTSPNLPTMDAVDVYPGTVMLEGTNISEGRGTSMPFQLIGAPYIASGAALITRVKELLGGEPPGVYMREAAFEPTAQKHRGAVCNGLCLHVLSPGDVRSFDLTLAIIQACADLGGGAFAWKDPPYEYDHHTLPMKLIVGSRVVEQHLGPNATYKRTDPFWHHGIAGYIEAVQPHLLYDRQLRPAE